MASHNDSPKSDPTREAEILTAVAEELHRLANEATERARAAQERADDPPLLKRIEKGEK